MTEKKVIDIAVNYLIEKYNKKIRRNDLCPCGSGEKYKNCCYGKDRECDINRGIDKMQKIEKENIERRAVAYAKLKKQMKNKTPNIVVEGGEK